MQTDALFLLASGSDPDSFLLVENFGDATQICRLDLGLARHHARAVTGGRSARARVAQLSHARLAISLDRELHLLNANTFEPLQVMETLPSIPRSIEYDFKEDCMLTLHSDLATLVTWPLSLGRRPVVLRLADIDARGMIVYSAVA